MAISTRRYDQNGGRSLRMLVRVRASGALRLLIEISSKYVTEEVLSLFLSVATTN